MRLLLFSFINKNNNTMSLIIRDLAYINFINKLTIDLIKSFNKKAIQIAKSMRITKPQILFLFDDLFGYFPMFPLIYEQIFARFRKVKYIVFSNQSGYFIWTITAEEEIDIYELCFALTSFVKCVFKHKIG